DLAILGFQTQEFLDSIKQVDSLIRGIRNLDGPSARFDARTKAGHETGRFRETGPQIAQQLPAFDDFVVVRSRSMQQLDQFVWVPGLGDVAIQPALIDAV